MNQSDQPPMPARVRRALHCLSLVLLPALAPEGVHALPRSRAPRAHSHWQPAEPIPYLRATGAPPLRFQEAAPPPDLASRPPGAAPPVPALTPTESTVALENAAAAAVLSPPGSVPAAAGESAVPASAAAKAPTVTTPAKSPPPILPDDVRPTVRPEDFLPFFQIPGAGRRPADVTVIAPANVTSPAATAPAIPPSSATYTQSPR